MENLPDELVLENILPFFAQVRDLVPAASFSQRTQALLSGYNYFSTTDSSSPDSSSPPNELEKLNAPHPSLARAKFWGLRHFGSEKCLAILSHRPRWSLMLREVDLSCCLGPSPFDSSSIKALLLVCPFLEILDMSNTRTHLSAFFGQRHNNLSTLYLGRTVHDHLQRNGIHFTQTWAKQLQSESPMSFPKLQKLDVSYSFRELAPGLLDFFLLSAGPLMRKGTLILFGRDVFETVSFPGCPELTIQAAWGPYQPLGMRFTHVAPWKLLDVQAHVEAGNRINQLFAKETMLSAACAVGDYRTVAYLVSNGANPDLFADATFRQSPLAISVGFFGENRSLPITKLLLDAGARCDLLLTDSEAHLKEPTDLITYAIALKRWEHVFELLQRIPKRRIIELMKQKIMWNDERNRWKRTNVTKIHMLMERGAPMELVEAFLGIISSSGEPEVKALMEATCCCVVANGKDPTLPSAPLQSLLQARAIAAHALEEEQQMVDSVKSNLFQVDAEHEHLHPMISTPSGAAPTTASAMDSASSSSSSSTTTINLENVESVLREETAFTIAMLQGQVELAKLLLHHGAAPRLDIRYNIKLSSSIKFNETPAVISFSCPPATSSVPASAPASATEQGSGGPHTLSTIPEIVITSPRPYIQETVLQCTLLESVRQLLEEVHRPSQGKTPGATGKSPLLGGSALSPPGLQKSIELLKKISHEAAVGSKYSSENSTDTLTSPPSMSDH